MVRVIRISEGISIALHALAFIASSKTSLKASRIAMNLGCSYNHLAKVLHLMAKNGYLSSTRGPSGGFVLKKPLKEINLLALFEVIDGKIDDAICEYDGKRGCDFKKCVFGDIKDKFSKEFENFLRKTSVGQLMK